MKKWKTVYNLCLLLWICFLSSCQKSKPFHVNFKLTQKEQAYFKTIALGAEFGDGVGMIKKWKQDIKIWVGGVETPELKGELNRIIGEINALIPVIQLSMVNHRSAANFQIWFGHGKDYSAIIEPNAKGNIQSNWGMFWGYWRNGRIYKGSMYVDIYRTRTLTEQKHLLREELTHALGLMNDGYAYPESIFQQRWTTTTTYAPIDKKLIQLLYDTRLKTGMKPEKVEAVLELIMEN